MSVNNPKCPENQSKNSRKFECTLIDANNTVTDRNHEWLSTFCHWAVFPGWYSYTESNRPQRIKIRATPTFLVCLYPRVKWTTLDLRSISHVHTVFALPSVARVPFPRCVRVQFWAICFYAKIKRPRRDSNSQSSDSKSDALSIRPRGHSISAVLHYKKSVSHLFHCIDLNGTLGDKWQENNSEQFRMTFLK